LNRLAAIGDSTIMLIPFCISPAAPKEHIVQMQSRFQANCLGVVGNSSIMVTFVIVPLPAVNESSDQIVAMDVARSDCACTSGNRHIGSHSRIGASGKPDGRTNGPDNTKRRSLSAERASYGYRITR
jgi:hypothetical protein